MSNESKEQKELHKVFIGNLSFTSTDDSLKSYFNDAGKVLETIIIKKGSRPKGYGFVAFATLEDAEKAVKDFDKKELDGREISVQLANQREPKPKVEAKEKRKEDDATAEAKEDEAPTGEKKKKRKSHNKKSRKSAATSEEEKETNEEELTEESKEEKPKTSVFVANLPLSVKKDDLAELFKDYQVESTLVAIQRSGRSKGYGFVELKTVEEMERVLKEFGPLEVEGRAIHVSAATSEKNNERRKKKDENIVATAVPVAKTKSNKHRKNKKASLAAKEKEGVAAAKEAEEAVVELKQEDGVKAAKEPQEAVKELKEEDGVSAAKAANNNTTDA